MKTRLLAVGLLLAMLLGTLGCAGAGALAGDNGAEVPENFISANGGGLLGETDETLSDNLMNIAATDEGGNPLFQIVYAIGSSLLVEDQCAALAADIYDVTGVQVPVVHSSERQKDYEILVGRVPRKETVDVTDSFDLDEGDFVIQTLGTRVLIYAEDDQALMNALLYFRELTVQRSTLQGMYGIEADYSYLCHYNANPPVTLEEDGDDRYVSIVLENAPMVYTYARLSYTGNNAWRLQTKYRAEDEYRNDGAAQVLAYSLGEYELETEDERFYTEPLTASQTGNTYTVTAPDGSRAEIDLAAFKINFYSPKGNVAATITNIACSAGGSKVTGLLESKEAVFGTGERFNNVNQRGKQIEMFTKDIWSRADANYMAIPLLCFSRGSGVFLNNYEHMVINLDTRLQNQWTANVTGAAVDCYIFAVDEIADAINGYSRLSGYADMPEEWTYGMLVCAYSPDLSKKWTSQIKPSNDGRGEGVYEMIANMETYDLPWTGVLAEGWSRYDATTYGDLKELCDYVHSLGKKFLVYWRVGYASSMMKGYSPDYLLTQTRSDGTKSYNLPDTTADTNNPDVGTGAGRTNVYLDVSNPEATAWFFDEFWDSLANDVGVDGCKIDFCETLPENYELNYFDENIPTAGSHHWYPTAFCTMFYDMISSKPDGGMCYTRGGGIGAQRAPYMWAGDQVRETQSLGFQLTATLSSGLSGVPYMSYDMAGYQYHGQKPDLYEIGTESKVFIRGTQFTAFTICMQTHGKVKRSYQFAEYTDENGDHPYEYVTNIYRAYTKLHEHLTPYLTELCEEASTTGMPVVRHLVLGWQGDSNVYGIDNQFTFGDAFLIAPVFHGTTRSVYLPEGNWEDLNTGTVYEVGAEGLTIDVTANIAELPTFFNMDTESETARELVDGIKELYDYARSLAPKE